MFVRLLIDSADFFGDKSNLGPLSTSEFVEFGIYLQRFGWMNLASFYRLLPYFIRQAVLGSRYSKGWFNQITDSVTFEPSDLIAVINFLKQMAESCR
jgi:hypothetical protein